MTSFTIFLSLCAVLLIALTMSQFEDCPSVPPNPGDRRSNKNRFRVLNMNVEWLFLDDSHSMGQLTCPGDGCPWSNYAAALEHMQLIAKYLDSFDADLLIFQEVCDCWTLQQLISYMDNGPILYKPYLIRGTDTFTGQNVGYITKLDPYSSLYRTDARVYWPLPNSQCGYSGSGGDYGCSKHFQTRFNIPELNRDLTVYSVHFLAYPDDVQRCAQREAQATVIANMVASDVANNNLVIVAGDYNDYSHSVSDINNNVPISAVTRIISEAGGGLLSVAQKISNRDDIYSAWYNCDGSCVAKPQCYSMIDQFYVSPELYNSISSMTLDHGFVPGCTSLYSDHFPYVVDFDLNQVQKAINNNQTALRG